MTRPIAYDPQQGYRYQILTRNPSYSREWEHCDYATDRKELNYLLEEYHFAYGAGYEFKVMELPQKYWKEVK